jgi:hypothetical protein
MNKKTYIEELNAAVMVELKSGVVDFNGVHEAIHTLELAFKYRDQIDEHNFIELNTQLAIAYIKGYIEK